MASEQQPGDRPRVMIAGGGIAGLEAALALHDLAEDLVAVTLLAPDPDFTYKPLVVEEPFSSEPAQRRALAPVLEDLGGEFVQQAVVRVLPEQRALELADGARVEYDAALICVGAKLRPAYRSAITLQPTGDPLPIDELLAAAEAGGGSRIAFVAPPGMTWPLPIYELALMTERRGRERGLTGLELTIVTPEPAPLAMFGAEASEAVGSLLHTRGIAVRAGVRATEGEDGKPVMRGGEPLEADAVIALPALHGPAIPGLPADEDGFIPIDDHARVVDLDGVYAAGDGTNFPIKQGGLGTQQADAAAEEIAARFGATVDPRPFEPVLRGKLLTGDASMHMRQEVGPAGAGTASDDYLWWPPHKVSGRYLAAWLADETPREDPEPPRHPLDVEVSLPKEWHREPMAIDPDGPPLVE